MFVKSESERSVHLSGCVDDPDVDGMWDVDVSASVPEGAALPAAFGSDETSPRVMVRLYRHQDGEPERHAEFDATEDVEVSGSLVRFDQQSKALEFDATLTKLCAGDCRSERSEVEIAARLSW